MWKKCLTMNEWWLEIIFSNLFGRSNTPTCKPCPTISKTYTNIILYLCLKLKAKGKLGIKYASYTIEKEVEVYVVFV